MQKRLVFLKRKIVIVLLTLAILYSQLSYCQSLEINSGWVFKKYLDTVWLPASVPGTVHTDLLHNKVIEDPYYRDNEYKVQWIDRCDWEYKTTFIIPEKILSKKNIELTFNGLDTYADVYLNGTKILSADNMFRTFTINVKKLLNKQENYLYIKFFSAQNKIENLAKIDSPFVWPTTDYARMYARKAQYSFGWDWGPKFTTCGIWKGITLNAWNNIKIKDAHFTVQSLTTSKANVKATYSIIADADGTATITLKEKTNTPSFLIKNSIALKKGINEVELVFGIANPKKWWTYQLGKPYLYSTNTTIKTNTNDTITLDKKIGLRTIELVQDKDEIGQSFYFKLNDVPVYIKGANLIPSDAFVPNIKEKIYSQHIANAKAANMNMLRVWGGGIYEDDALYNACDEAGILLWQDCMFACAMYPSDSNFLNNVQAELVDNITRLRNHPSLAIWCGNNEIDEGWKNWGWKKNFAQKTEDSIKIWKAYDTLFNGLIPTILKKLDPQTPYHTSSPVHGWLKQESITFGDQHYWGLWGFEKDIDIFYEKTGRFVSEYGMQAMPTDYTIKQYTLPEDLSIESGTMITHQKHPKGYPLLQKYLGNYFKPYTNFKDFCYLTQCLQHLAFSKSIEIHRGKMPINMGTIFWQLNDCWPVTSWSTVDYYNQWKAAMYGISKAYVDILISLDNSKKDKWELKISNDLIKDAIGNLNMQLYTFDGKLIDEFKIPITATKLTTTIVELDDWISKRGITNNIFASVKFAGSNKIISENVFVFDNPKDLALTKPTIIATKINDSTYSIKSNVFAKYVQLSMANLPVHFSDNFFDLLPNQKKIITLKTTNTLLNNKEALVVESLFDVQ